MDPDFWPAFEEPPFDEPLTFELLLVELPPLDELLGLLLLELLPLGDVPVDLSVMVVFDVVVGFCSVVDCAGAEVLVVFDIGIEMLKS